MGFAPMLSDAVREALAADLAEAETTRVPLSPLTVAHPGIDVVDAYEIQLINIRRRLSAGATVASGELNVVHDDDETLILTFSVIFSPNFYDSHSPRLPGIPFSVT